MKTHRTLIEPKLLAETQAILDRATLEGFTLPNRSLIKKLDFLLRGLKKMGFLQLQDFLLNFAYNDTTLSNFSLINIANPTGPLATKFGGITYTAYGYLGNGTDSGINSQFNPFLSGVNYTQNNASRGMIQFTDNPAVVSSKALDSCEVANNVNTLYAFLQSAQRINQNTTNLSLSVSMSGLGYKGINRDTATNVRLVNKAVETNGTAMSETIANGKQLILARIDSSSVDGLSFYNMGGSISTPMSQAFRIIYNNYLTSIGLSPIA